MYVERGKQILRYPKILTGFLYNDLQQRRFIPLYYPTQWISDVTFNKLVKLNLVMKHSLKA